MKLAELIENPEYDSATDLISNVRHMPDGFGFFDLSLEKGINPIFSFFSQLPPHAEYDLDVKHFNAKNLPQKFAFEAIESLIRAGQNLVGFFQSDKLEWTAESAYLKAMVGSSRKSKPLLLNVCSRIDAETLEQSSMLRKLYGTDFDLLHVGVQFHCSDRDSVELISKNGDRIAPVPSISQTGLLKSLENITQIDGQRPMWIRLNLNALPSAEGGNDQSWATGISTEELLNVLEIIYRQAKAQGMSIGPFAGLHTGDICCRTAAQILSNFVYAASYRKVITRFHARNS